MGKPENTKRTVAQLVGDRTFMSAACVCGCRRFYTSNGACVDCTKARSRARYATPAGRKAQRDGVLPNIVRMLSPCRVQLNGFEIHARSETALIVLMDQCDGSEVILQANDETKAPFATLARQVMAFNTLDRNGRPPRVVSLLHDPSGGKGLVSGIASDVTGGGARVPSVPEGVSMGFAGGIREESVEKAARKAMAQDPDVESWLDLETGARDESDKFDLARVERILAKVAPFVRASVREGETTQARRSRWWITS